MSSNDPVLEKLLQANAQWAQAVTDADSNFFPESAKGQSPAFLWIGCSDSRVPESVITASKPGYIFTHRNIANQVHLDDDSLLSVVQFAVGVLGVRRVLVVGHSNCGGVVACIKAAGGPPPPPTSPLVRWLTPLADLARSHNIGSLEPSAEAISLLVRESVRQQVQNLTKTETIKEVWAKGLDVQIHGLVYDLSTGRLTDLGITQSPQKE